MPKSAYLILFFLTTLAHANYRCFYITEKGSDFNPDTRTKIENNYTEFLKTQTNEKLTELLDIQIEFWIARSGYMPGLSRQTPMRSAADLLSDCQTEKTKSGFFFQKIIGNIATIKQACSNQAFEYNWDISYDETLDAYFHSAETYFLLREIERREYFQQQ